MNKGLLGYPKNREGNGEPSCVKLLEVEAGGGAAEDFRFDVPQNYRSIRIVGHVRGSTTGTPDLRCTLNGVTSGLYDTQRLLATSTSPSADNSVGAAYWNLTSMSSAAHQAGIFNPICYDLPNYASTEIWKGILGNSLLHVPGVVIYYYHVGGMWRLTEPIRSIRLYSSAGGFAAGSRISLYGLN